MLSVYVPRGTALDRVQLSHGTPVPDSAVWFDLVTPTLTEDKLLERHLGIAVPTREELQESVRRLAGAGLLVVEDDVVEVAPAGEQLWRTRPFSGLSSAVMTLQAQLNRASEPGDSGWVLDEQTYNAAVREYSLRLADGR